MILPEAQSLLGEKQWNRREFVATALASGFALSVQPVSAQTIATDDKGLVAGEVKIPTTDGQIPAYRAMPATGGPFPVVLVVQEIFGVHEHIKDLCRRLAKTAYFAVAPELYARQGNVSQLKDVQEILTTVVSKVPDAQVMSDLDATVDWAGATGRADASRLAVTGFCWGGRITWLYCAHNPRVKAGVAWYGRLVGQANALMPKNPIDFAETLRVQCSGSMERPIKASHCRASMTCERPCREAQAVRSWSFTRTPRTGSTPTTVRAIARKRLRTAGSACSPGSRHTARAEGRHLGRVSSGLRKPRVDSLLVSL